MVTFLEMRSAPRFEKPILDVQCESPIPPKQFRELYQDVGRKWGWNDMLEKTEDAFNAYCGDPNKRFYTLHTSGNLSGFFVLDQQNEAVDLAYFGLLENATGQGMGKKLLRYAIIEAWETQGCEKVTVNTCTLDHPAALALYQNHGFVILREEFRKGDEPSILHT